MAGSGFGAPSGRGPQECADVEAEGRRRAMARHPSAAHQKLRVLVRADAELSSARIFVEGCVTAVNIHGLDRVVQRVDALSPGTEIVLDLTNAEAWDTVRGDLQAPALRLRMAASSLSKGPVRLRVLPPRD